MSKQPPDNERRLNMHLMGYWQSLRGNRPFVTPEQFDPNPLGDFWAHCFVVDAHRNLAEMTFRHLGQSIAAASMVPTDLDNASQVRERTLLATALQNVPEVLQDRQPDVASGAFTDIEDRRCVYRSILLPLCESDTVIKYIAGGAGYRVMGPER